MQNKLLFLRKVFITFLLITFFCIFSKNVNAASFNYASFDWDNFVKEHPDYWADICNTDDEECKDDVLITKKQFYTRLYELLTKYQNKGFTINDNIIIETVFFGLTPDSFKDYDPEKSDEKVYSIDEDEFGKDINSFKYIADVDGDPTSASEYFKKETDSLKTLLNNMIGYLQKCYGETSGKIVKDSNGNVTGCDDGSTPYNDKCVDVLEDLKATYWDKLGINNIFNNSANQKKCDERAKEKSSEKNYISNFLGDTTDSPELNVDFYWKFLRESDYFDKKPHLQKYFGIVLDKANKKSMTDPAWGDTEEAQQKEKLKYKNDIEEARQTIIDLIKDILEKYEELYGTSLSMQNASNSDAYWWPIGSDETTQDGDIIMATGEPSFIDVASPFGMRTYPHNRMHYGIDINGTINVTNVISSKDGVVFRSSVSDGVVCSDTTDANDTCGGGFGNYLIIQHSDGNYTTYGHMEANTVTLKVGDSVRQGQVIGKIGSSGGSTGGHLHFEIRVGGTANTNAIDPLNYISSDNPRPVGANTELVNFIHNYEGTPKESGDNYVVFNDGFGNRTIGWGVYVSAHSDLFSAKGINVNDLTYGSQVEKSIVDEIEKQILQRFTDNVNSTLSNAGINLKQNQIDALIARAYSTGNINGFVSAYKAYGDTEALYTNYISTCVYSNGKLAPGLVTRRKKEWKMFHEGIYELK